MDILQAISQRHSYRGPFTDAPVPREDLTTILQAGLDAPSGCNKQTTSFIVIDAPELLDKIAALEGAKPCLKTAPAIILCIIDTNPAPVYMDMEFQVEDCAAAVENILLATTAHGYASVWIDGWLRRENRARQIAQWINLPPSKTIRVILPIGHPAEPVTAPRKHPFNQRVSFNTHIATRS